MKHKKAPKKSHVPIIITVALLACIAVGTISYFLININQDASTDDLKSNINYNPPSSEETTAGQDIKDTNEIKDQQPSITNASIFIVDATQYDQNIEVRAYIKNVIKDGGECTYTFTGKQSAFATTSPASADASHTTCKPLIIPVADFPASGKWSLVISYIFDGVSATSRKQTIEVSK